jgi:hypothetical protein
VLVGYYEADSLMFTGKVKNGFVVRTRQDLARRFNGLETEACPFANLPEPKGARRGEAITATVMKKRRWRDPSWWRRSNTRTGPRETICGIRAMRGFGRTKMRARCGGRWRSRGAMRIISVAIAIAVLGTVAEALTVEKRKARLSQVRHPID